MADVIYNAITQMLTDYVKSIIDKALQGKKLSDQEYLFLMNYYSSKNMEYLFSEMRSIRDEMRGLRELMDKKYSEIVGLMDKKYGEVVELIDKKYAEAIAYADKSRRESMEYTDKAKKEIMDYVDKRFNEFKAYVDTKFDDTNKRIDDMRDIFINYFNQIIALLSKR